MQVSFDPGMWTASFYGINFIAPPVAGLLVDAYGFRMSTLSCIICLMSMLVLEIGELVYIVKKNKQIGDYEIIE